METTPTSCPLSPTTQIRWVLVATSFSITFFTVTVMVTSKTGKRSCKVSVEGAGAASSQPFLYLSGVLQSLLGEGQRDKVGAGEPKTIEPIVLKDKLRQAGGRGPPSQGPTYTNIGHRDVAHQLAVSIDHGNARHSILAHALEGIEHTRVGYISNE